MSAFKRHQSKVLWDRMAVHDLEDNRFAERNEPPCDRIRAQDEEDDDSNGKSENDTTNSDNVTAIYVCRSSNEDLRQGVRSISLRSDHENATQHRAEAEETDMEHDNEMALTYRFCQDFKSQDSGFSDSERSDPGVVYENAIPRREKLRRKRIRQHRIRSVIASSSAGEESLPDPIRTSTPKDRKVFKGERNRPRKWTGRLPRRRSTENEEEDEAPSISLEDERLGDFLYATEPPEDKIQTVAKYPSVDSVKRAVTVSKVALNSRNYLQSLSITAWVTDLATTTENECGNALQNKNLPRRRALVISGDARDLKLLSSAATAAASKLLVSAEQFEQHYRSIVEKITHLEGGRSEMGLLRNIEEAAFSILYQLGAPPPRRIQQGSLKSILAQLYGMKVYVDGTIDTRLDFYIEKIVRCLDEAPREDSNVAKGALAALTALGLSDSRAGSSIARCSGIKTLLTCLIDAGYRVSDDDLVAVSLRALASICSSATAIEYFAKDGGPEILTDLLAAESTSEKEKTEATALAVQITAPWTNALGLPYLEPFADSLIPALNRLIESTGCAQTLLLAAAALNQMSKSRRCANIILAEESVRILLRSVKRSAGGNVWLMEQVAALIGELARVPEGRSHLAKVHASVALVSFLRMRPPGLEDAYHRLEITATAALTRLCVEPEIAEQVVTVGGGDCLPTCRIDEAQTTKNDETQVEAGLLKYTRSLRRACKKAARQIGIAKAKDHRALD